ncbi:hypothetical protein D3C81_1944580 [compost metagenome]
MCAVAASALASASVSSGFPAYASQARDGKVSNHWGSSLSWFSAMRINSSRWHWPRLAGRLRNRLPASMSFCSRGRCPSSLGNCSSSLSVRINQRNCGGRAVAGTRCR